MKIDVAASTDDDSDIQPVIAGQQIRPTASQPAQSEPDQSETSDVDLSEILNATDEPEPEASDAADAEPVSEPAPVVASSPAPATRPAFRPDVSPAPSKAKAQPSARQAQESEPLAQQPVPQAEAPVARRRPVFVRGQKRSRAPYVFIMLFFLIAGAAGCWYLYQKYEGQAAAENKTNAALVAQTQDLQEQIKKQTAANNGTAVTAKPDDLKSLDISLADGKVTATVPKDWTKVPVSDCTLGSRDSKAVCQAVVGIAPNEQMQADGTPKWSAQISVFDYAEADGNAQKWFETKYDGTALSSYTSPKAVNIKTDKVNDDSALQFQMLAGTTTKPTYVNGFYVIVHGKYAVVIRASLQSSSTGGSAAAKAYDYRTTYGPTLQSLLSSLKFKD